MGWGVLSDLTLAEGGADCGEDAALCGGDVVERSNCF
jgi:hypothetical protein